MKQSVCVYIKHPNGLILGVSRKHDVTKWGLPGGKLDPGETFEEAAVRELREETGLKVNINQLEEVYFDTANEEKYECKTFKVNYSLDMTPTQQDGEGLVAWISWKELMSGPFFQYNTSLYVALAEQS